MKVIVYASQLAALTGRNYFVPKQQVMASMLKRMHPKVFEKAQHRNAKSIPSSKARLESANIDVGLHVSSTSSREASTRVWSTLDQSLVSCLDTKAVQALEQTFKQTLRQLSTTASHASSLDEQTLQAHAQQAQQQAFKETTAFVDQHFSALLGPNFRQAVEPQKLSELDAQLSQFVKQELAEPLSKLNVDNLQEIMQTIRIKDSKPLQSSLRQVVATSRGQVGEDAAIKLYENIKRTKVKHNNAQLFTKHLGTTDNIQVVLVGKVDGFCDGKLVEVKNRQKRFFPKIPLYERVQLLAYMFLTDTLEADHVECLDQQIKSRKVDFDQEEFQQITQDALHQAKLFAELVHDSAQQDALITWMVDNHKSID
jgi:hypothetical protein